MRRPLLCCLLSFGLTASGQGGGRPGTDAQILRAAGIADDGPALLAFFRQRIPTRATQEQVAQLIRQLGAASFRTRERATRELVRMGRLAQAALRTAAEAGDPEVRRRSFECCRRIEAESDTALLCAAVRILAQRRPAGAAAALLDFLPFAHDAHEADEVADALAAVAMSTGRPEPILLEALRQPDAVRRAAAAEALTRNKEAGTAWPAVLGLLHDADAGVRLRVALALATARHAEAVPVLIDLLAKLPVERAWEAEDLLVRLAGDEAPAVALGPDSGQAQKCRAAWAAWWAAHRISADFGRLDGSRTLGYTLVVLLDVGRVLEVDGAGRTRWQVDGVQFPLDAQWLPGGRVLIAENQGDRVTERSTKGEVVWEKQVARPIMAQRLPNGNTFMATQARLFEVDRGGRELFAVERPGADVMKAVKLPSGDLAFITTGERYVRMDSTGRITQDFPAHVGYYGGRLEVLPNGHVVSPEADNNRVVEYDTAGRVVWQFSVDQPVAAAMLPNGNTLVTQYGRHRGVELNRAGKEVWSYEANHRVTRLFRR